MPSWWYKKSPALHKKNLFKKLRHYEVHLGGWVQIHRRSDGRKCRIVAPELSFYVKTPMYILHLLFIFLKRNYRESSQQMIEGRRDWVKSNEGLAFWAHNCRSARVGRSEVVEVVAPVKSVVGTTPTRLHIEIAQEQLRVSYKLCSIAIATTPINLASSRPQTNNNHAQQQHTELSIRSCGLWCTSDRVLLM